jgi:predicted thioesterase
MPPTAGARATVETVVGEDDTAVALGSGDVPVLATPRVLALAERATVAAVADAVEPGRTTVGSHVELTHLRATFVGARVTAEAILDEVDGDRLRFSVRVVSGDRVVAEGSVTRVVADRSRFTPSA